MIKWKVVLICIVVVLILALILFLVIRSNKGKEVAMTDALVTRTDDSGREEAVCPMSSLTASVAKGMRSEYFYSLSESKCNSEIKDKCAVLGAKAARKTCQTELQACLCRK